MPFTNFHVAKMTSLFDFEDNSFHVVNVDNGIKKVVGRLKHSSTLKIQSYRFDKNSITAAEVKNWLNKNHIKPFKFEAASAEGNPRKLSDA